MHNLESFVIAFNTSSNYNATIAGLLNTLSNLNNPYINPVRSPNAFPIIEALKLIAGVSGIVMCLALAIIASSASEYMLRSNYNLFWYMHHFMAPLFIIGFIIHDIQGVVRKQTNLHANDPQRCYLQYKSWSPSNKECDVPKFSGLFPSSWIWILIPVIIYLIERIVRFKRGLISHKILNFIIHPSNVLELQMEKNIKYTAGQYLYLNCPEIARFEWHPFTITSAPDDPYLSAHIRSAGDWTENLFKKVKTCTDISKLTIHIDGAYGTCAEDVFNYKSLILIGAGIGTTPYACILKHACNSLRLRKDVTNLNKVYFFWICPSIDSFEWFGEALKNLENELNERKDLENILEYKIYLTKGWTLRDAEQIVANANDTYDLFTGLKQKTNYGRPNFELFFKDLSTSFKNGTSRDRCENFGVFFCGPQELSSELHKLCNFNSNNSVRFIYNKENF